MRTASTPVSTVSGFASVPAISASAASASVLCRPLATTTRIAGQSAQTLFASFTGSRPAQDAAVLANRASQARPRTCGSADARKRSSAD